MTKLEAATPGSAAHFSALKKARAAMGLAPLTPNEYATMFPVVAYARATWPTETAALTDDELLAEFGVL